MQMSTRSTTIRPGVKLDSIEGSPRLLAWPERKKMEESKMSEEFHDWLDKCPVQWHRDKADDDSATYTFIKNENSD